MKEKRRSMRNKKRVKKRGKKKSMMRRGKPGQFQWELPILLSNSLGGQEDAASELRGKNGKKRNTCERKRMILRGACQEEQTDKQEHYLKRNNKRG